jgi:glycosyltransferase involved in cell wall biosynthesis
MPEIIGDAAQFFDPSDMGSIRDAIDAVVTSRERREQLIALGHQRLLAFSWAKCAAETLQVYRSLR